MHGKISTYERTSDRTVVPCFSESGGDGDGGEWHGKGKRRQQRYRSLVVIPRAGEGTMRELIAVVVFVVGGANSTPSRRASNHERRGERGGKSGGNCGLSL